MDETTADATIAIEERMNCLELSMGNRRLGEVSRRLLDAARAEGSLRADATTLDLKLLFAATRAAKQLEPDAWPRMLELLIDSLRRTVDWLTQYLTPLMDRYLTD